jgi:hypothetical protein
MYKWKASLSYDSASPMTIMIHAILLAPHWWLSQSSSTQCHALLDFSNGKSRVQTLRACPRAIKDGMTAIHAHAVVESVESLARLFVTRVIDPTIALEENGRAEILLAVPPVRWAGCAAAGA